jgi:hypothetical protein
MVHSIRKGGGSSSAAQGAIRPAGMQAMGPALYAQVCQAVRAMQAQSGEKLRPAGAR